MNLNKLHTLGIDIASTTVKIAILDSEKLKSFFQTTNVILQTFRKHYPTCSDGHFTNSVQFRFLLSLQEAEVLLSQNI